MPNILTADGVTAIGGLEWIPLEGIDSALNEVKEAIARRRELIAESSSDLPLGGGFITCDTKIGTYSAGILPDLKGFKIPKNAVSLAVLCSRYAQKNATQDALFAWRGGNDALNLVAIKNGLPIFDGVMSEPEFKAETGALLSMFETGCSVFGDPSLLPPPVAELTIHDLAEFVPMSGKIRPVGAPQWVQVLVFVAVLSAIGGYFVWDRYDTQKRAEEEVLRGAQQPKQLSPKQIFEQAQAQALSGITGCESIDKAASELFALHYTVRSYRAAALVANCADGMISAEYHSPSPADLSIRSVDNRLRLTESLTTASLKTSFQAIAVSISMDGMRPWQDWLVEAGQQKQRLRRIGIEVGFGAVSPVFNSPVPSPQGVRVAMRGNISIAGSAQYLREAAKQFNHTVWKRVAISDQNGVLTFNLTGDYYVVMD